MCEYEHTRAHHSMEEWKRDTLTYLIVEIVVQIVAQEQIEEGFETRGIASQ